MRTKLASVRLIAADIKQMVTFYEMILGLKAEWLAPVFAEIVTPGATLAIGASETIALWKEGSGEAGANRTAYLEFQVEDIDAEFERLKDKVKLVHELPSNQLLLWVWNVAIRLVDRNEQVAPFADLCSASTEHLLADRRKPFGY